MSILEEWAKGAASVCVSSPRDDGAVVTWKTSCGIEWMLNTAAKQLACASPPYLTGHTYSFAWNVNVKPYRITVSLGSSETLTLIDSAVPIDIAQKVLNVFKDTPVSRAHPAALCLLTYMCMPTSSIRWTVGDIRWKFDVETRRVACAKYVTTYEKLVWNESSKDTLHVRGNEPDEFIPFMDSTVRVSIMEHLYLILHDTMPDHARQRFDRLIDSTDQFSWNVDDGYGRIAWTLRLRDSKLVGSQQRVFAAMRYEFTDAWPAHLVMHNKKICVKTGIGTREFCLLLDASTPTDIVDRVMHIYYAAAKKKLVSVTEFVTLHEGCDV